MVAKKSTKKKTAKKSTAAKWAPAKRAPAKRRTASRSTAKVSPLKGMPVAEWVKKKVKGWQSDVVRRLLDMAARATPDATVTIKWGQPVFEHGGPVAWIKPAKAHVTFGFWRGAEMSDEAGVLEGGSRMRHIKIASPEALDEATVAAYFAEAVELNRKKGDPTRRGR
jgi:hypothetical protein